MRIVAGQSKVSLATRLFVFAVVVWAASPFGGSAAWAQFIDATAVTAEIRARQSIALVGKAKEIDKLHTEARNHLQQIKEQKGNALKEAQGLVTRAKAKIEADQLASRVSTS